MGRGCRWLFAEVARSPAARCQGGVGGGRCGRRPDSGAPQAPPTGDSLGASLVPSLQDLFFKYTWNNFLHLQVELCIATILSHAAREDRAAASGPEDALEPPPSSGDPAAPQPASSLPEGTMVTHVSPAGVMWVAVSCQSLCVLCALRSTQAVCTRSAVGLVFCP